jgi:iron(III) transport system substrate-binding protein
MKIFALFMAVLLVGCSKAGRVVVVYSSQDQVFAEPILAEFTKQTGIKVLPVFDSESIKTAGLVQRLMAEKNNPRADVFWSNEEMLARRLLEHGALDTNHWTAGIGYRTRRLIVNTNFVSAAETPKSLTELTNAKWSGRVAMAYPIYGTTAAHMVALRQKWGDANWKSWCEGLAANKPFIVDGNSVVVKLVGAGEAWIGLTDSDDFEAGLRNRLPIAVPVFSNEMLWIPNSVGMVKGAPHPQEAMEFLEFIKLPETLNALVQATAVDNLFCGATMEGTDAPGLKRPLFALEFPAPVDETIGILKTIFTRK